MPNESESLLSVFLQILVVLFILLQITKVLYEKIEVFKIHTESKKYSSDRPPLPPPKKNPGSVAGLIPLYDVW
jgi:hypothetical protein